MVGLRLVVEGVGLDVMGFHEVTITNSTAFDIFSSIVFGARTLVKFPKGRVGHGSRIRNLIFYIFLNGFLFESI